MDISFDYVSSSAKETQIIGEHIGHTLLAQKGSELPHVLCLWGELGSGKTTFVQGLARSIGITTRLLSPTFIIVRRYNISKKFSSLYHLDLYRMNGRKDIEGIGFDEMISDANALVIIEWPERLGDHLPDPRIDIRFSVQSDGKHHIVSTLSK